MRLPQVKTSFVWIIFACGAMALGSIVANLTVLGLHRHPNAPHQYLHNSDSNSGRDALIKYGCGGCHVIPGLAHANGRVGPSLVDFHEQTFIAGILANTPENLTLWIENPSAVSPHTAMPDLDVSPDEARSMAAYLYLASKKR